MDKKGGVLTQMLGPLLFVCGLGGAAYFYFGFDPSVQVPTTEIMGRTFGGGRVNNLGLMQDRQNGILFGFGAAILGGFLMYLGRDQTKTAATDERTCPFCAEFIKSEAIVCRFCQKEVTPRGMVAAAPTALNADANEDSRGRGVNEIWNDIRAAAKGPSAKKPDVTRSRVLPRT